MLPPPGPTRHRLALPSLLTLLCTSLLAVAAQAASVQEAADPLQRQPGTAGGKTLDRALEVDTQTGQRNLDLLLEARSAGEASGTAQQRPPAADALARRQAMNLPATAADHAATAASAVEPALPPAPLGLQANELPTAAGSAPRREWLGEGSAAQVGMAAARDPAIDGQGGGGADGISLADVHPALRSQWLRDTVFFLKDNRYWLLGGAALIAAVVAGIQAGMRRR